jgi:putative hemolysin
LSESISHYPTVAPYADSIAMFIVVAVLSYLSVIIGELVPKRIALSNPERFAALAARPMKTLSRLAAPAVAALEITSDVIIKLLRLPQGGDTSVSEADVAAMVAAGTAAGVFEPAERRMVERVFRLDDEVVAAMMTPRRDIVWLDVHDSWETNEDLIRSHRYSRFPVCDGSLDQVLGIVNVRDLWVAQVADGRPDLRALARQPLLVPDRSVALDVLEQFQKTGVHVAIVIDEHGGVDGMLTLNNILAFLIAAPIIGPDHPEDAPIVQRGPDSWLVDGSLSLGDFYSGIGVEDPEADETRPYHTVAGLVMTALGRMPSSGDRVTIGPLLLEVADMDGFRVDKVLVTKQPPGEV